MAVVGCGVADPDRPPAVGEIREFNQATTASLNAMREDINDLRSEMRSGFAEVDRGFVEIRGQLDAPPPGSSRSLACWSAARAPADPVFTRA